MALTKESKITAIEVVGEHKAIQVGKTVIIKDDGVEISRNQDRHVIHPDQDISGEDAEVQAIADVVWTQAVKDAWAIKLAEE